MAAVAPVPLAVPLAATGATGADRKADDDGALPHSLLVKVAEALPVRILDSCADWIKVGMVLHDEGYACEQWDAVSMRSAKYAEGVCAKHWASFGKREGRKLTAATLWRMLKEENPSVYWELMEHRTDMMHLVSLNNHDDAARYFYRLEPDKYVWCEELGWYALGCNNVWVHSGKTPTGLKRSIAATMKGAVMELKKVELDAYARNGAMITDQEAHRDRMKKHQATIGLIHAAYKQFGSSEFVNGVISFLPSYYADPKLEGKMDMSHHLYAFTDAVFDLSACAFRPIEPCDYVSTTTGYKYPKQSDPVIRDHLERLLFSLFENQETKEYLLKVLAWCLLGKNRWEQYYVFTGSGGNGKGVIIELVKAVFGDYYIGVDITLFTNSVDKRDAPCPVLVEARPKRVMVAEEPESEARLQAGFLKNLSGGSTVRARTLHSGHNVSYVPGFKIIILTNDIPKLTQMDGGSERRLRVVQFPFKFVAPGKVTEAHHRVGDPDVKDKLSGSAEWRDEMCLMLTETYAANKDMEELSEPGAVVEATRGYVDANNVLKEWLDTYYEITRRDGDRIGAGTMKQAYMADMRVERMSDQLFKAQMEFNKVNRRKVESGMVYTGIKRRAV
jgi:P4 family phage/plasmid primase-like protien